jgi:predicted ThiF/HesA family dinucleotide-utilizing enzyme
MVTKTEEKLFKEIQEIKKETKILKDLIFLLLKDPEGEYKKTFINRIQKKAKAKPRYVFTNKKDFLKHIYYYA